MAVLVTGGAGYIGSHTCVELLNEDYKIVIVDNLSNSKLESLERVKELTGKTFSFYNLDLLDRDGLNNVFHENSIEAVIHFAGLKVVGESLKFPLDYYQNNITGSLNLFEAMEKNNVTRLVFSSSANVYGKPKSIPINENSPLKATNPYGRTKIMIEQILSDHYASNPQWSISLLRYFNPVGAHPSGKIGEDPKSIPTNLFPYITQVATGRLKELNVFGNDYKTVDGTGVRDYLHVVDLSKGHLRALEKVFSTTGVNAYNLGTGKGFSVLEILDAFEKVIGKKISIKFVKRRPGDIAICIADPTKANEDLGWVAEKSIMDMCSDAWRWQQYNPLGYYNSNFRI